MRQHFTEQAKLKLLEPLFTEFGSIISPAMELNKALADSFSIFAFRKREILALPLATPGMVYFMMKGIALSYMKVNGERLGIRFIREHEMIHSPVGYYRLSASGIFVELFEDALFAVLEQDEFARIQKEFEPFNLILRKLAEKQLLVAEQRADMLAALQPQYKFRLFVQLHPTLVNRVPDIHIAAYLGLNRSTLNRVKREYFSNGSAKNDTSINT
jgi:CRP/FNR family transcriptional regulator, anaerobic regulatory protein